MLTKAFTGADVILVDNAKAAITHVGWIIVITKGKAVFGIQPAVVDVATIVGTADGDLRC